MINRFHLNYPQGSLTSELITIEHGKYIVKVTAAVDSKVMATGLAGAATIEEAEDRARDRALSALSFSDDKIKSQAKPGTPNLSLVTPPPPVTELPREIPKNSNVTGDLVSDTIAEINLQMKRLEWTKEQGAEYLLKTYGKKSRHLLSDQELLEFLGYLQNQPEA
ncbi:hypothetical protein [Gloeocapsa sp. PCC 73106]|uniref:hypothetical protein n=1 Tax=Gloeocapsa sp. PCC 73106 TaxID=102232 RepID=UPI0002ACEBA0|nr:hypothetical protein [Gloeocapsa sp. PCC 73106]ELR97793.1 hypothetical protein GLO73106DRAFT_00016100 [Gloeocapsa sp. PCC 73106]